MKLSEAITQRVKSLLDERGLKPYFLFKKGGIPRSTLSALLNGNIKNVSTDLVYQICATLIISLETFYSDKIFDNLDD